MQFKAIVMSEEIQYRVFSLSSQDIFPEGDLGFAMDWLNVRKRSEPYFFRKLKPRNLAIGSFILLMFEGRVFGRARTSSLVTALSEQEQRQTQTEWHFHYSGKVSFDPNSIDVFFERQPLKGQIEEELGITFSRNFTKLKRAEYERIVRMSGHTP
jgi:hypothetical protein